MRRRFAWRSAYGVAVWREAGELCIAPNIHAHRHIMLRVMPSAKANVDSLSVYVEYQNRRARALRGPAAA